uniref:Uncharacterized protein n=1 Tax=Brassica oleracea TaxID=3712 RepID=A0A3P6H005_BRAOL|nr:unnamed protein product [Brassica oleracea]
MTRAELRERIDLTENERNPKKSKHLETGKMRLCNQWLDFVQLRKEEADENSCCTTKLHHLLHYLQTLLCHDLQEQPHCCRCTLLCIANYLLPMPLALSAPRAP